MTTTSRPSDAIELPVSVQILQVLEAFAKHTSAIFEDLSSNAPRQGSNASSSSNSTLRSLEALSELDDRLAALVTKAKTHEANQRRIEQLEDEMMAHELKWRKEMLALEADRKSLELLVNRGKKAREQIDKASKGEPFRICTMTEACADTHHI
jgi:Zn-dependent M32 family carboxypeptidase